MLLSSRKGIHTSPWEKSLLGVSHRDIVSWREAFQNKVDELAEGDYLQFTCEANLQEGKRESPAEYNKELAMKTKSINTQGSCFPLPRHGTVLV